MKRLTRCGLSGLAAIIGFSAWQWEPTVGHNLATEFDGGTLSVGAIRAPLWNVAFAQSANTLTLDNVTLTSGTTGYQAKRIEFSGLTSSRGDIDALLSKTSSEPFAVRLARLNAQQIRIPELKAVEKVGPETQTVTYRNVVLSDVKEGRVSEVVAEATVGQITSGKIKSTFNYGRAAISALDIPALIRVYETKAPAGDNPFARIHGAFSVDGIAVDSGQDGIVKVGRISGRDFMARPIADSWVGGSAFLAEVSGKDDLSPDQQSRLIATIADFLGSFEIGSIEATDFTMTGGKAQPGTTARIGRMSYRGATATQPGESRMEGFEIVEPKTRVAIAGMAMTGFSLTPTIEGLKKLRGKSFEDVDAATLRSLTPTLGAVKIEGIDIDSLTPSVGSTFTPGVPGKTNKVRSAIRSIEFLADQPVNGIPTNLRFALQNLTVALPATSEADGLKDLLALGYKNVDMSFAMAGQWSEGSGEFNLRDLSFQGADMANLALSGSLGNITKDVFDPDTAVATVAFMAARIKSLDLRLENKGLFERFIAKTAKEEKTTPESLRQTYGMGAAIVVPSLIGNSEQASRLSQAIARFVAKPGLLMISAKTKDPSGLGVVEALSFDDPKAAFDKLDITARAE
ncbi:hypothetical protein [Microvirga antarctica]|uniref:hypothetical protein n=1 Tax=Microvirga antarctica TaxID=2819233 RepID=UPI001B305D93|nr:hypothetical protein [Microvirga antarctica]